MGLGRDSGGQTQGAQSLEPRTRHQEGPSERGWRLRSLSGGRDAAGGGGREEEEKEIVEEEKEVGVGGGG